MSRSQIETRRHGTRTASAKEVDNIPQAQIAQIQPYPMQKLNKALLASLLVAGFTTAVWQISLLRSSQQSQLFIVELSNQTQGNTSHQDTISTLKSTPHPPLPLVCILIPATSAGQGHWSSLQHTFLYQYPLQTIPTTYEPNLFTYRILIGYDTGDPLFDNPTTLQALRTWSQPHTLALTTHSIPNPLHKPGPVMNYLSTHAHSAGCDFLYRINDDTELLTPWTSAFVSVLASFSPPNIGVVGPTCHEGNTAILTHDFVHRSHIDIFGSHYPTELTDWWLDDWISLVYGDDRTLKLPQVIVLHHVLTTRYEVTWNAMRLLKTLVETGNTTLSNFIANRQLSPYSTIHHDSLPTQAVNAAESNDDPTESARLISETSSDAPLTGVSLDVSPSTLTSD